MSTDRFLEMKVFSPSRAGIVAFAFDANTAVGDENLWGKFRGGEAFKNCASIGIARNATPSAAKT